MYRRGRISNRMQHWVLGGVCRYSFDVCLHLHLPFILGKTGEAFLEECPKNNRDRQTLEEIILK